MHIKHCFHDLLQFSKIKCNMIMRDENVILLCLGKDMVYHGLPNESIRPACYILRSN